MTNGNGNGLTKPVTETVKALSGTPMLLALILMNVLILGMVAYLAKTRSDALQTERADLLKALSECVDKLNHGS